MKILFLFVQLISAGFVLGQKQDYLKSLFEGTISKDDFLIAQKYANLQCEGFEYHVDGGDQQIPLINWVYEQDFTMYRDSSIYFVSYEFIHSTNDVKLESIHIYERATMNRIRSFLNSYYPNSGMMSSLNDSDLDRNSE